MADFERRATIFSDNTGRYWYIGCSNNHHFIDRVFGDQITGTEHPKILRAEEEYLSEAALEPYLVRLKAACIINDCDEIQEILLDSVSGFEARDGISDAMWHRRQLNLKDTASEAEDNVITGSFPKIH